MSCSICGGDGFSSHKVLWDGLIAEWEISPAEAAYIDDQQGKCCATCGGNLRAMVLGEAIRAVLGTDLPLQQFAKCGARINVLDLNGCAALSDALAPLPGYVRKNYPEVDMLSMPFEDGTFDLVFHSDTLEHVPTPQAALVECRRILKPNGSLCLTVPIIVGRMTRGRAGLRPSYHGNPATATDDLLVRTEFGADAWTYLMRAGFKNVLMTQIEHPAAHAMTASCA